MTPRFLKALCAFALLVVVSANSHAAVVYKNGFENLPGNGNTTTSPWTGTPDILHAGLTNSQWATSYSAGFISYSGSCGSSSCQALGISHNNYPGTTTYTLTFSIDTGYILNITSLSFWSRTSGTGPTTASITINGTSAVNSQALGGTSGANTGNLTPVNTFTNLTGTVTLVITLSGATGAAGTFRLDDFIINGLALNLHGVNAYDVTGGDTFCAGDTGRSVNMDGSDTGVVYQLLNNGVATGQTVTGTGNPISFGLQTAAGTYTIFGTRTSNGDTATMSGDAINIVRTLPVVNLGTPPAQCDGSITLDAGNAGSTFLWSDNSTNQTDVFGISGTYSVVVTDSNGCSASGSSTITINTAPSLSFSITSGTICPGASTTITAQGASTYVWSTNATTDAITVRPLSNTSYLVTGTDANNCTATASTSVNVTAFITSSVSQQICPGSSYNGHSTPGVYNDTLTTSGGCDSIVTLTLTLSPPIQTSISQNICAGQSYNGHNANGNYTDTFTAVSGCDSIVSLQLTVAPALTGTNTQTICGGASYNGHNATGVYTDTLISISGCDSLVTLNLTVLPLASLALTHSICQRDTFMGHWTSGDYTDTFINGHGCDSVVYLHLIVNPLPHTSLYLTFDTVCSNATAITMSGGSPAGGYYSGQGIVSGQFVPSVAPLGRDTIYYNYTDSNGCFKARYEFAYTEQCTDSTVGINEISSIAFSIMPNPVHDVVNIEAATSLNGYEVSLYDLVGRIVLTQAFEGSNGAASINLQHLAQGVYIVSISQGGNKIYSQKIVKN